MWRCYENSKDNVEMRWGSMGKGKDTAFFGIYTKCQEQIITMYHDLTRLVLARSQPPKTKKPCQENRTKGALKPSRVVARYVYFINILPLAQHHVSRTRFWGLWNSTPLHKKPLISWLLGLWVSNCSYDDGKKGTTAVWLLHDE